MKFQLIFSEEALWQLKKLDNKTAKRILDKLESTTTDPVNFFERLAGREEYKLRVGDYRILARILIVDKKIFVMSIGHIKKIYK